MSENVLYSCSRVSVRGKQGSLLDDLTLSVGKKELIALISEDESAGDVLKLIAGLYVPDQGKAVYPAAAEHEGVSSSRNFQYVPDDIVCYDGLCVEEFLHGMAGKSEEARAEAARLVTAFGIDRKELLLEMTFEQNRLVSIIQAMMVKPALLLMNRPYDMLGEETYLLLLKELIRLYMEGATIVIAGESFADVVLPCHRYLYLEEGKVTAACDRARLPKRSKVVTMWGGQVNAFRAEEMEVLASRKGYVRFLYRKQDMQELAFRLSETGCENFTIEEVTMEEELFHNYERWRS